MKRSARWPSAIGFCIALLLMASPALGAGSTAPPAMQPWEQVLAQQLELEQKCTMASTFEVQEWPLGNEVVRSGKARCHDGREFDFSQQKRHLKFEIRTCEPAVC